MANGGWPRRGALEILGVEWKRVNRFVNVSHGPSEGIADSPDNRYARVR